MNQAGRTTFQDEILKLQELVLDLAKQVKSNGDLLLEFLRNKEDVQELFFKIKEKDKEIDKARWQVHDYGDQLIVLQQPVAKDFRHIVTSIQVTDNFERIGDHFKKTARKLEKVNFAGIDIPKEIIEMAEQSLKMLSISITAYENMLTGEVNDVSCMDDRADELYKQSIRKTINLIKASNEDKIDSLSKLLFIAQSFERASDHAAKIGDLVNFAILGKRNK